MPRRTTMPLWHIPTYGPAGPHTAEDLLASNPALRPWAEIHSLMVEARAREFAILNLLREAGFVAPSVVRPGALTEWIEGMIGDAAMMLESFESVVRALDRHIAKKFDAALTNTAVEAVPAQETAEIAREYPVVKPSRGRMNRRDNR